MYKHALELSDIRIFKISDYEIWAGKRLVDCIIQSMEESGCTLEETACFPTELPPENFDKSIVIDDDTGEQRTMREEIELDLKRHKYKTPWLIAAME